MQILKNQFENMQIQLSLNELIKFIAKLKTKKKIKIKELQDQ